MPTVIQSEDSIRRLRDALRRGDTRTVNQIVGQLILPIYDDVLNHAEKLIRQAARPLGVEGADLMQEAAVRMIAYLERPESAWVRTSTDLTKLLYSTVRNRFLDVLEQAQRRNERELDAPLGNRVAEGATATLSDYLVASPSEDETRLFWDNDGIYLPLIEALFTSDDAFRAQCYEPPHRRPRQYRACVLFGLAEYFRSEFVATNKAPNRADQRHFTRYLELLGVPPNDWAAVVASLEREPESDTALFTAINELYGTNLQDRSTLTTLRYDLRQLSGQAGRRTR